MKSNRLLPIKFRNKKVHIVLTNSACTLSVYGVARYRHFFRANDWAITNSYSDADLILLHTCAYNQAQEDLAFKQILDIQRKKNPDSHLVVSGCMPKICKQRLQNVFTGISFGPRELTKLDDIINAKVSISAIKNVELEREDFSISFLYSLNKIIASIFLKPIVFGMHKYFNIKIEPYYKTLATLYDHRKFYIEACVGCLGKCAYCAIRFARGRLKSAPIEKVVEEFRYGLQKGYKRFVLLGDDLGDYGRDINTDLVALLEEILKIEGDYEILLYYLEPMGLGDYLHRLKPLFSTGKIIDVNIPVQTGSNRLSKLMNRHYDVEEIRDYVSQLRREFPTLNVRAQMMVGFPGETEEDFRKTLELFDDFDEVGIFGYSDRPHTPASKMVDKVPEEIIKARAKKLRRKYLYNLYFRMPMRIKFLTKKYNLQEATVID
jgi:threonylcarbamoyladenosine tRNA methylthiotransferase MtaB